jgi:stage II sporulation protein D
MPSNWAPEALKAQAVAARSYALATKKIDTPFDAYADTRSQMYLGLSSESAASTAAVNATKRQVLFYNGTVACWGACRSAAISSSSPRPTPGPTISSA